MLFSNYQMCQLLVLKILSSTRLCNFPRPIHNLNSLCHASKNNDTNNCENVEIPEEPTTCCMSGCANCVWVEYAEKLSCLYKDGGATAWKKINEKVTDPNMKAFLMHELRMRKLQK